MTGESTGRSKHPAPGHTARRDPNPDCWHEVPVVPINAAQAGNPRGFASLCNSLSYAEGEPERGGQEKGGPPQNTPEAWERGYVCSQE